jgi:hypothetical protein
VRSTCVRERFDTREFYGPVFIIQESHLNSVLLTRGTAYLKKNFEDLLLEESVLEPIDSETLVQVVQDYLKNVVVRVN